MVAPVGLSLHMGLNVVDPDVWGSEMPLRGCHNDARAMLDIAKKTGFQESTVFLDGQAKKAAVMEHIAGMAQRANPGDLVMITYSGHGSQEKDKLLAENGGVVRPNGGARSKDETDGLDELWCLFDGPLLDDRLRLEAWPRFQQGVRILVLSDSCNSGTVTSLRPFSPRILDQIRDENRELQEALRRIREGHGRPEDAILASVLLISGCQDNQFSMDSAQYGAFTDALLKIWNGGAFSGDYRAFHRQIVSRLPGSQKPNYFVIGEPNPEFEGQKPFTI